MVVVRILVPYLPEKLAAPKKVRSPACQVSNGIPPFRHSHEVIPTIPPLMSQKWWMRKPTPTLYT